MFFNQNIDKRRFSQIFFGSLLLKKISVSRVNFLVPENLLNLDFVKGVLNSRDL